MRIGIELASTAYLPEAYAYEEFFKKKSISVEIMPPQEMGQAVDVGILFMGFNRSTTLSGIRVIHEYNSLSTPPFPRLKNWLKGKLNPQPDGRIFLNQTVSAGLKFDDEIPYIYRDMGVHEKFFEVRRDCPKDYDLVYSGTTTRPGLIGELVRLSKLGFRIMVIGAVSSDISKALRRNGIHLMGMIPYHDLPELFSLCRAGLNFTPDRYPYNIQTSTKSLEYLCAGLTLVTNRYRWINEFATQESLVPLWLEELKSPCQLMQYKSGHFNGDKFRWDKVLEKAKLVGHLDRILSKDISP